MYIGVDGCSAGWVAVQFDEDGYEDTNLYEDIQELWMAHDDATEQILIDSLNSEIPDRVVRDRASVSLEVI